jgi:very-short-patch-repair endonuclease
MTAARVAGSSLKPCCHCSSNFRFTDLTKHEGACDSNPENQRHCPQCGAIHTKSKFCSKSCSATYNNKLRDGEVYLRQAESASNTMKEKSPQYCKIGYCKGCGKVTRGKKRLCGSTECEFNNRSDAGKKGYSTTVSRNKFKGWKARTKEPSYPEKYFIQLFINENINDYERELKVDKYFIDFAFKDKMVALEIDGKQHELPDRKEKDFDKDNLLSSVGWKVFRIKWFNPRTDSGKDKLYPQIKEFLKIIRV